MIATRNMTTDELAATVEHLADTAKSAAASIRNDRYCGNWLRWLRKECEDIIDALPGEN